MPNRLQEQVHVKKFASDKISSFAMEDGLQIHVVIFCLALEIGLPLTGFQATVLQKCKVATI